jgi:hypothetical protein
MSDVVTWRLLRALLLALAVVLAACPQSPGMAPVPEAGFLGAPFSQADLVGQWRYAAILHGSGVASGTMRGWERGWLQFDADGAVTVLASAASDGHGPLAPQGVWRVDADGFVTATSSDWAGFRVKLGASRTLAAGIGTADGWASALWVMERVSMAPAFSESDLAGSDWHYHRIVTGAAPAWEHGMAHVDGALGLSFTARVTAAGAQPEQTSVGTLTVDPGGGVALGSDPTWAGVLSIDKKVLVITRTVVPGSQFALEIWSRSGLTLSAPELAGVHASSVIVAGPAGAWGWSQGTFRVDDAGTRLTWLTSLTNAGSTTLATPATLVVAQDGTITTVESTTFHANVLFSKEGTTRTATAGTYASFGVNFR